MRRILLALFGLPFVLAGCVQPPDLGAPTPSPVALDAASPFAVNFTAECLETDVIITMDLADAQKSLPPGFHAADISTLFPQSAPSGKGGFLLANIVCKSGSLGPLGESAGAILVQEPKVAGTRVKSTFDFYEAYRYMDNANESAPFAAAGWDWAPGKTTAEASPGMAKGTTSTNGTQILTFSNVLQPEGVDFGGVGRFWHVTPGGLAYMDYAFASKQYLGGAQCTLAAGSPYAKIAGATSCTPTNSVGAQFGPYSLKASIVNLPGVHAT